MKVTITEFSQLPHDSTGNVLPLGTFPANAKQVLTAAGSTAVTSDDTRFIRVATDTAITIIAGPTATATDPMIPANSVEYFGITEGVAVTIALA